MLNRSTSTSMRVASPRTLVELVSVAAIWLFMLVFWGILVFGDRENARRHMRSLSERTVGHVVDKQPANHRLLRYAYAVGGRDYAGATNGDGYGRPSSDSLTIGSTVDVSYDPANPTDSCACDPGAVLLGTDASRPWLLALFAATVCTIGLRFVLWPRLVARIERFASTEQPRI